MMAMKPQRGCQGWRRRHSSRSLIVRLSARLLARAAPWRRPARRRACWHPRRAPACAPSMRTSAVKRGAWSGPSRATSTYRGRARPLPCAHSCSADLASAASAGDRLRAWRPRRAHDVACLLEACVEKDRTEQRFAGVGQDRLLVATAAARLRFAQDAAMRRDPARAPPRAGPAAHQAVVEARKLALRSPPDRSRSAARRRRGPARGRPGTRAARCRGAWPWPSHAGVRQRLLQQRAVLEDDDRGAPRGP